MRRWWSGQARPEDFLIGAGIIVAALVIALLLR
jgi:hypothetical protein